MKKLLYLLSVMFCLSMGAAYQATRPSARLAAAKLGAKFKQALPKTNLGKGALGIGAVGATGIGVTKLYKQYQKPIISQAALEALALAKSIELEKFIEQEITKFNALHGLRLTKEGYTNSIRNMLANIYTMLAAIDNKDRRSEAIAEMSTILGFDVQPFLDRTGKRSKLDRYGEEFFAREIVKEKGDAVLMALMPATLSGLVIEEEALRRNSFPVLVDSELGYVFDVLKHRMEVPDVQLRIIHLVPGETDVIDADGHVAYVTMDNTVYWVDSTPQNNSTAMRFLIHELTHAQQVLGHRSAYQADWTHPENRWKMEQSADASAAGAITCVDCLKEEQAEGLKPYHASMKKYKPDSASESQSQKVLQDIMKNVEQETGYFSPKSYDPYIASAMCEGSLCRAHQAKNGLAQRLGLVKPKKPKLRDYLPEAL